MLISMFGYNLKFDHWIWNSVQFLTLKLFFMMNELNCILLREGLNADFLFYCFFVEIWKRVSIIVMLGL